MRQDTLKQHRFTSGQTGQIRASSSWLSTPNYRPVALTYAGQTYRLRIYPQQVGSVRRFVAMAKVGGELVKAPAAKTESHAQAEFIRLIDGDVECVKDVNGRQLA